MIVFSPIGQGMLTDKYLGGVPEELLGSMLRIDVNSTEPGLLYGIPDDNPFVGDTSGRREEIYAYGFRNPHRITWDPVSNLLIASDIGFHTWEEVNIVRAGANHGWANRSDRNCRIAFILIDGEFAGAVNRVPAPDDLRSNMVRGGAALRSSHETAS